MTTPSVGEYLFVISDHADRPRFVSGVVVRSSPQVVELVLTRQANSYCATYSRGTRYSFPLADSRNRWRIIDPPPFTGTTPCTDNHAAGALAEVLEILDRATQLQLGGDNVGVFVPINHWRDAIELLKEVSP